MMADTEPLNDAERENLSAYLDGELDPKTAQAVEAKISLDPQARQEVESLRRAWDLLDYLPRPEPAADFTHRTLDRLAAPPAGVRSRRFWVRAAGWAAALLLAAFTGFAGTRHYTRSTPESIDAQLAQDLQLIENIHVYELVDDIDFLHKLANPNDPDLFGDDSIGS
jgi:anti-sigma factor RsiW